MAIPAEFLDELRTRTPLASLVGRRVRLTRSGRQLKGCCPFHGEKTPSFYVYDDGYHCFGCGAHGDAISFVMQTQGSNFIDAVTALSAEAGLELPAPSPAVARAEERRQSASAALEAARVYYQRQLNGPAGREAREYLVGRGLSTDTIAQFGLGWSGAGRGALIEELKRQGAEPTAIEAAGLLREIESGEKRELFFNRVMFPIRDRRGRLVSFGGRTLGPGQPKYLNGPETDLYSKRLTLYGLDRAREPVRGGADLLVAEGYMDVISLHQAGFKGAVAPLGTALTSEQLEELWRLSPAPILSFDGDTAGSRAALRALDLALPQMTPERTIRLILLPAEHDPDSLIRAMGPEGFHAQLKSAIGATEALFNLLRGQIGVETPEQRARLRSKLEAEAARIRHKQLASEYRRDLLDRFFGLQSAGRAAKRWGGAPTGRNLSRPVLSPITANLERARILTAILLRHPALWRDVDEAFHRAELPPWLAELREAIFRAMQDGEMPDGTALVTRLQAAGLSDALARVFAADPLELPACARTDAMPAEAEQGWWYHYGLLYGRGALAAEISTLASQNLNKETQGRLIALRRAQRSLDADPESDDDPDE